MSELMIYEDAACTKEILFLGEKEISDEVDVPIYVKNMSTSNMSHIELTTSNIFIKIVYTKKYLKSKEVGKGKIILLKSLSTGREEVSIDIRYRDVGNA